MYDKLYRPVKWERTKDWRLTQKRWERPEFYKKIGRPYHLWLDYAWPKPGDQVKIYASHSWLVKVSNDPKWFWKYIVIDGDWFSTYYAHLAEVYVKWWDQVMLNDEIWLMGNTGNSSAVHLHFWLRLNDRAKWFQWWIDPTPYMYDREKETIDPLIQTLIDDWIWNGVEWEWMTKRIWLVIAKLYNKLKW